MVFGFGVHHNIHLPPIQPIIIWILNQSNILSIWGHHHQICAINVVHPKKVYSALHRNEEYLDDHFKFFIISNIYTGHFLYFFHILCWRLRRYFVPFALKTFMFKMRKWRQTIWLMTTMYYSLPEDVMCWLFSVY